VIINKLPLFENNKITIYIYINKIFMNLNFLIVDTAIPVLQTQRWRDDVQDENGGYERTRNTYHIKG